MANMSSHPGRIQIRRLPPESATSNCSVTKAVALPPKVFDALLLLVEKPGPPGGKEDFLKRGMAGQLRGRGSVGALHSHLRKALRTERTGARHRDRFPKRGYRFVAAV